MASFIAEMLDYNNTHTFFTPFGGGCRVLLNKPRHLQELYAEVNAGMSTLVKMLTQPDTAIELMERLYETDYSEECFKEHLAIKNSYEDHYLKEMIKKMEMYLSHIDSEQKGDKTFRKEFNHLIKKIALGEKKNEYLDIPKMLGTIFDLLPEESLYDIKGKLERVGKKDILFLQENINTCFNAFYSGKGNSLTDMQLEDIDKEIKLYYKRYIKDNDLSDDILEKWSKALNEEVERNGEKANHDKADVDIRLKKFYDSSLKFRKKLENETLIRNFYSDIYIPEPELSDMDLAVATYVVFSQSRDGIGKVWNSSKFKTNSAYHKRIDKLYDVMHRLEGVHVLQQVDSILYLCQDKVLNNERWMVYCDPPYLRQKALKHEEIQKNKNKKEYNPGLIYKNGWSRADHERFLNKIQDAKCKMLISNYVDEYDLYDTMLCGHSSKWKRIDYETYTSVSNNNKLRTECLWYNY